MDIVAEILKTHKKDNENYKSINVEKHLDVRTDVGMMFISDPNDLDENQLKINKENYLRDLTRDNVQILINQIWELPTERVDESIVAKLPPPQIVLPRIRKVPSARVLTKWEQFAKEKGIKKKKKDKKVFDEQLNKWIPKYGYRRTEAEKEKDWVLEVPKTVDPMEDMFQKKKDLRSEKVAKNEIQRMKNIVRAKKLEIPRTGYFGPEAASSKELLTAVTVAKASTASMGKFQEKIQKEKEARGIGVKELIPGCKRKASHITQGTEREENLSLIKNILNKKPKIDVDKAISLQKQSEKEERAQNQQDSQTRKKMSRKSKKFQVMARKKGKKPKGGKGQRAPGKKSSIGRKRR